MVLGNTQIHFDKIKSGVRQLMHHYRPPPAHDSYTSVTPPFISCTS